MVGDQVLVVDKTGAITGKYSSQLSYWGFQYHPQSSTFTATPRDPRTTICKLLSYLTRHSIPHTVSEAVAASRAAVEHAKAQVQQALEAGTLCKRADRKALKAPAPARRRKRSKFFRTRQRQDHGCARSIPMATATRPIGRALRHRPTKLLWPVANRI
jgi:hypothetical protein